MEESPIGTMQAAPQEPTSAPEEPVEAAPSTEEPSATITSPSKLQTKKIKPLIPLLILLLSIAAAAFLLLKDIDRTPRFAYGALSYAVPSQDSLGQDAITKTDWNENTDVLTLFISSESRQDAMTCVFKRTKKSVTNQSYARDTGAHQKLFKSTLKAAKSASPLQEGTKTLDGITAAWYQFASVSGTLAMTNDLYTFATDDGYVYVLAIARTKNYENAAAKLLGSLRIDSSGKQAEGTTQTARADAPHTH